MSETETAAIIAAVNIERLLLSKLSAANPNVGRKKEQIESADVVVDVPRQSVAIRITRNDVGEDDLISTGNQGRSVGEYRTVDGQVIRLTGVDLESGRTRRQRQF